jgi:hypothetical protein
MVLLKFLKENLPKKLSNFIPKESFANLQGLLLLLAFKK